MPIRLAEIHALACRFVPQKAASWHLYEEGARSWWPAHEIGHFLIATRHECQRPEFGLSSFRGRPWPYRAVRELAAMSISQRLLRHSGHTRFADEEIQHTSPDTLKLTREDWYARATRALLHKHHLTRLPTTHTGLERLLLRKSAITFAPP